jgi:hypothetical protein
MRFLLFVFAATLAAGPALAEAPAEGPQAVWAKTKVVVCEVLSVQNCRTGGCAAAPKLPSFRIDIAKQTMCAVVSGGCKSELKVGQVGLDRGNSRMTVHALGAAFVVGVDADGTMNGADVVKGRVVAIQGRCVAG